ncbi:MAG: cohesin domain-containing protein [Ignavibacteriales bacterium]|nr:cohesin domain-containing protein [Ignavibacteriales bacterium]
MHRRVIEVAILLFLAGITFGQVKLNLPDTTAAPGSSLILPIFAEGFKSVGSLSLTIAFDKSVMTFNGVRNQPKFGYFNATAAASANVKGSVSLSWFNVSPALTIRRGKLLDLDFTYKNGISPLTFERIVPSSVTDSLANNLKAAFRNGKVSPLKELPAARTVKPSSGLK